MALNDARFLSGSIMRHVVVMALTGSFGLMFMFLVDAAAVFWVAQLQKEELMAALGFAWSIQFFTVSAGIGMSIAALALVSKAIGAGRAFESRATAGAAIILTACVQAIVAGLVLVFRWDLLALLGADDEIAAIASRFLTIAVPSLPLMAVGIVGASVLRASGYAYLAMMVTLSAGCVAMVLDPLLIVWAGWEMDGAAIVVVLNRATNAAVAMYFVAIKMKLVARPRAADFRHFVIPFAVIAIPATLTQTAAPMGNFVVTYLAAEIGDSAVAGWTIAARIMIFCFGGLFALSGAIGGIFGQNFAAGKMDRVRSAYTSALIYCVVYALCLWAILAMFQGQLVTVFKVSGEAANVLQTFLLWAPFGFLFLGGLFVATSVFNTLGRPLWSTALNWLRDGIVLWPCIILMTGIFGTAGLIHGQIVASIMVGTLAAFLGWRFVVQLDQDALKSAAA